MIAEKEILDLEKEIGIDLVVNERPYHTNLSRFYVSFKDGESMEKGCLVTYSGNGNTIDEALSDYASEISCRRMVYGAYTNDRKEITLPKIIHTKLVNK